MFFLASVLDAKGRGLQIYKKKNFEVPASFENLNFTEHSPRARALKFADFL